MKPWFVILQQIEIDRCKTPVQIAVFAAIKSYTSNGAQEVGLSLRDISRRCHYSVGWIRNVIQEIEKLGLVFRVGTVTRLGGTVQVFRVGTVSVPVRYESVPKPGIKVLQSKKEIKVINSFKQKTPIGETSLEEMGWAAMKDPAFYRRAGR